MDEKLIGTIKEVLQKDRRVIFAYLHGSILKTNTTNDIDIAIYSRKNVSPYVLSADLKVALYNRTGIAADTFDIHVINDILDTGDLFALIFLKNVFSENVLLVDRVYSLRTDFLERYGMKFRECEGLISEIVS